MAVLGLVLTDPVEIDAISVWPENEATVRTFMAMGTQWNVSAKGAAIGLRYESLPAVMRFIGIHRTEQSAVFSGLRTMEHAALGVMNG
jgi:hypothetical protein